MAFSKYMRDNGIKVTPQRRAVYSVLTELCHCSVEEVVAAVTTQNPDISVATVYNILDCFAQKGLISKLSTPKGRLYYDITGGVHHHIFTDKDQIIDFNDDLLTEMISDYLDKNPIKGVIIDKVSLQIFAKDNTTQ